MKRFFKNGTILILASFFCVSCESTPAYRLGESRTDMFGENVMRYGSMAGGGAGGYMLGESLLGGTAGGAMGAAAGVGLAYAANKYVDSKRMDAYNMGRTVGAQEAREEQLNEQWKREAVYGLPPENSGWGRASKMRNVYVPSRTVNGVQYPSGKQQVMVP